MKLDELDFHYPEHLVATERAPVTRVLRVDEGGPARELMRGLDELIDEFMPGDALILNDSRVIKRRIFTERGLEILFLQALDSERRTWQVLCPSSRWKPGTLEKIPGGIDLELRERGRLQTLEASAPLSDSYFETHGEMPLPPYIQKARRERHHRDSDQVHYQTAWAKHDGSLAAPTASLHFSHAHLDQLRKRGVGVAQVTLHVGLGTFLPVTVENLDDHAMHAEAVKVPKETWELVQKTRVSGGRVWALGTTVTRSLESVALGKLALNAEGDHEGLTDLFIRPGGHEWRVVDGLLTNFHQPRSTLLALVASFAGLENVHRAYRWAIENQFRLFSYGDLTAWTR